jgi:L-alanine-DL-glutamate epimerase-like enolase superfamily enzyme
MQVGGFLESRIGFTASAHLALVSDGIEYFDFDSPLMMEEDPVIGGITYEKGGAVLLSDTPGLGATVDEMFLKRLEKLLIK